MLGIQVLSSTCLHKFQITIFFQVIKIILKNVFQPRTVSRLRKGIGIRLGWEAMYRHSSLAWPQRCTKEAEIRCKLLPPQLWGTRGSCLKEDEIFLFYSPVVFGDKTAFDLRMTARVVHKLVYLAVPHMFLGVDCWINKCGMKKLGQMLGTKFKAVGWLAFALSSSYLPHGRTAMPMGLSTIKGSRVGDKGIQHTASIGKSRACPFCFLALILFGSSPGPFAIPHRSVYAIYTTVHYKQGGLK